MYVRCRHNRGYNNLTESKLYEVKELIPQLITTNYTFPRYVKVIDDSGSSSIGHAYRFETIGGINCEEYIKNNIKDIKDKE